MENKEVVSIVIPIYNVEAYLKQCLETIVNQTYPNLEIILVNDGSTDRSDEFCKKYANTDNRVVYVSHENRGVSALETLDLIMLQEIIFCLLMQTIM